MPDRPSLPAPSSRPRATPRPSDIKTRLQEGELWEDEHVLLTPPIPIPVPFINTVDPAVAQQNATAFWANQQAFSHNAVQATPAPQAAAAGAGVGAGAGAASSSSSSSRKQDTAQLISGLHIQTDVAAPRPSASTHSVDSDSRLRSSASAASLPRRVSSVRAHLHSSAGSVSPGTFISSPQIAAMLDITPLPSPTLGNLELWKTVSRTRSRGSSVSSLRTDKMSPPQPPVPTPLSPTSPRRKAYPGLTSPTARSHTADEPGALADDPRTRSVSEYVPEPLHVQKPRHITVSTIGKPHETPHASTMLREEYLGDQRGVGVNKSALPPPASPPPSADDMERRLDDEPTPKRPKLEVFTVRSVFTGEPRSYEAIRELGQGTFSTVYLAVRQMGDGRKDSVDYRQESVNMAGVRARSRRLVAVKVVEHGPAGGADAERIEVGLQREVEILRAIQHPSLVHLKGFGNDGDARALLVMSYSPGGDLFEVASMHRDVLTPALVRRIFAELVSAVRYLHQKFIVHRDIKLENVLLNIPVRVHADVADWTTLDRAVVTLTDLGLSRRIPEPPESPLLTTRCGSEDYAAPEILMGQPYDGRQTDAWALGVLLYALMEGRLPFDPVPGARGDPATLRARTPHRIARCEWSWVKYGDEDGEWDAHKGREFQGAAECVDGILKRNTRRKPLAEIRDMPWVKNGIDIDGGLRWVEEEAVV